MQISQSGISDKFEKNQEDLWAWCSVTYELNLKDNRGLIHRGIYMPYDLREPGVDTGQPSKGIYNSAGKRWWWLKIGRWHLVPANSQMHAFESRVNITSYRLNVNCEKKHKNDFKDLDWSSLVNGDSKKWLKRGKL